MANLNFKSYAAAAAALASLANFDVTGKPTFFRDDEVLELSKGADH